MFKYLPPITIQPETKNCDYQKQKLSSSPFNFQADFISKITKNWVLQLIFQIKFAKQITSIYWSIFLQTLSHENFKKTNHQTK